MTSYDKRGFAPIYRPDRQNDCPGCTKSNWLLGRVMAECAFCATAIPLAGRDALLERAA